MLIQTLKTCVLEKNNIESDLYGYFTDLLNTKKVKIAQLQEQLDLRTDGTRPKFFHTDRKRKRQPAPKKGMPLPHRVFCNR